MCIRDSFAPHLRKKAGPTVPTDEPSRKLSSVADGLVLYGQPVASDHEGTADFSLEDQHGQPE
eukprot:2495133-Alexandrium_andersonii.AAC.1